MPTQNTDVYICVSIHQASSDETGFMPLFEERFTLLRAGSLDEAKDKAQQLVKGATHSYKNDDGSTVSWKCERIVEVTEVIDGGLADGSEIYGRYFRDLDTYDRIEAERRQLL